MQDTYLNSYTSTKDTTIIAQVPRLVNRLLRVLDLYDILCINLRRIMKISFYTVESNFERTHGYGVAGYKVVTSLQQLGYTVPYNDATAPVQLNFCQPNWFADFLRPNQYQIAYTPWESTELPEDWLEIFNECDEVWTTSDWVADIYKNARIEKTIKVYLHGIDPIWKPIKRVRKKVLKFFHNGEPALRKGGQMALDAFREAFGDAEDVSLTFKANKTSTIRSKNRYGNIVSLPRNVRVINALYDEQALVDFYRSHDIMVYPSYGEGFGFIPLQALATGMPTICTAEWAPYRDHLHDLALDSQYIESPWQVMHPGQVVEPNFEDLVKKYRYAYEHFEELSNKFFKNSFAIHKEYDWLKVTKDAAHGLKEKFQQ